MLPILPFLLVFISFLRSSLLSSSQRYFTFSSNCLKVFTFSPDRCGSVGWVSSRKEKGCWWFLVKAHIQDAGSRRKSAGGNRSMFLSHINVSLPLFLPPFPPSFFLKKKKKAFSFIVRSLIYLKQIFLVVCIKQ